MASPVESALRRAVADLDALKVRWALGRGYQTVEDLDKLIAELGR